MKDPVIRTPVGLGLSDMSGCGEALVARAANAAEPREPFVRPGPLMISRILATASVNMITDIV